MTEDFRDKHTSMILTNTQQIIQFCAVLNKYANGNLNTNITKQFLYWTLTPWQPKHDKDRGSVLTDRDKDSMFLTLR